MAEPTDFMVVFNQLVEKDVADLSDFDKDFIRSRQSYLNGQQREKFASILKPITVSNPVKVIGKK